MFKRLLVDDSALAFVLTAFFTAATIFVAFAWRAIRMPRSQIAQLENLPFSGEPVRSNESKS
jgi:hypothetical protein